MSVAWSVALFAWNGFVRLTGLLRLLLEPFLIFIRPLLRLCKALLFPFWVLQAFEPLYVFVGSAGVIGVVAGLCVVLTSKGLGYMLGGGGARLKWQNRDEYELAAAYDPGLYGGKSDPPMEQSRASVRTTQSTATLLSSFPETIHEEEEDNEFGSDDDDEAFTTRSLGSILRDEDLVEDFLLPSSLPTTPTPSISALRHRQR